MAHQTLAKLAMEVVAGDELVDGSSGRNLGLRVVNLVTRVERQDGLWVTFHVLRADGSPDVENYAGSEAVAVRIPA